MTDLEKHVNQPYYPKGIEKLDPKFRDGDEPASWTGIDACAWFCFG